eukprot:3805047-Pyramimonas_sp.AAC.1
MTDGQPVPVQHRHCCPRRTASTSSSDTPPISPPPHPITYHLKYSFIVPHHLLIHTRSTSRAHPHDRCICGGSTRTNKGAAGWGGG